MKTTQLYNMALNQEDSTLTPIQCRMARAALRLGVRELGKLAGLSPNTVVRFERGENFHHRTIKAIHDALKQYDVIFEAGEDGYKFVGIKVSD